MNARHLAGLFLLAVLPASAQDPLRLGEVIASVERSHPVLLASIAERAAAEGKELSAQGAFDTKLSVGVATNQFGYYKNRGQDAKVKQPLRDLGGELYGGYKRGQGNFGPWEQDLLSLSRGEWSGGFSMPLLRNRETDERRTELRIAQLAIDLAGASIAEQRLLLLEAAARSYWDWASAGQKLAVARDLLTLAEQRADQVRESVDAGQIAAIEITDNERAIWQRRSAVVSAERAVAEAAFKLSLFYRDDQGAPVNPGPERLPGLPEPTPPEPARVDQDLDRALTSRPEIAAALTASLQTQAALDLARNNKLPSVDVTAEYSRDAGDGSITKRGSELIAGLRIESPFQRRKAKGQILMQEAKLDQIEQKLRFTRDKVRTDTLDAVSEINAAWNRLDLARREAEAAAALAEAEAERFSLGSSTLFVVNLRELSAAEARLKILSAWGDALKAEARYLTVTAGW